MAIKPNVLDISHHQTLDPDGFEKMYAAGIRGVIHKASEGTRFVDKQYARRRVAAKKAGLLWGAYHFANSSSPAAQVDNFLRTAKPDDQTLLALDFEPAGKRTMSVAQAREFLELLMEKTGRTPKEIKIYGGSVLKEKIRSARDLAFFGQFDLWLSHYTTPARVKLPKAWQTYWLWQYSDTGQIPGISRGGSVDLNIFRGDDLAAEWAVGATGDASDAIAKGKRPTPKIDKGSAKAIVKASRRLTFMERVTNFLEYLGMGSIGLIALVQPVRDFVTDWRSLAILLLGALIYGAFKWSKFQSIREVAEGRYVPSKMTENVQ